MGGSRTLFVRETGPIRPPAVKDYSPGIGCHCDQQ